MGLEGRRIEVDLAFEKADPLAYDAMVLPGGRGPAGPRKHPAAVAFVKRFAESGGTIAAICHGPQMLAAAGYLEGRRITGYPRIRDEIKKAGAEFVDAPVVIDGNLITSRVRGDLPAFNRALEEALSGRQA